MAAGFLVLLLLFTGGSASSYTERPELLDDPQSNQSTGELHGEHTEGNCSYQDLFRYLHLTKNNELFTMVRPVKHYRVTTWVELKMVIYAILDVREVDQTLILYTWIYMSWKNHHILWDPKDFCGLNHVVFPNEAMWKPDLFIEEMTEKDKAPPSPYISVTNEGIVELRNDQVLVTTCRMQVYKFPFDIQRCNISFKSALHCDDEIKFEAIRNASKITEWSHDAMQSQYEWLFINMTVTNKTVNHFGYNQSMIIYTISMKRRPILYIVNFLLPILFFLCLDLASFLISDSGGEKLGFKVTVLLAVTVLQLILNEILPASSDRIPLIATFCIGIFGLMMLSLLETIFVMYLMRKDLENNEADEDQSLSEDCGDKVSFKNCFRDKKKWTHCVCVRDESADETPSELMTKQGSSNQLTEESHALEKVSDELREVEKTLSLVLKSRKEEAKPAGYWTRVTKRINKAFFIFYVTVARG
ncbi:5-hydroxytryptamine receptor 3A-like [Pagrus major]|uniref:5-hydroxytryptamine receptor 3A-like n=1 Tax=Pagrus major TaxID=143350 RepID=UPI003CC8496B